MLLAALIGLLQLLFNVAGQILEPLFGERIIDFGR
jgi:hypothetical protein